MEKAAFLRLSLFSSSVSLEWLLRIITHHTHITKFMNMSSSYFVIFLFHSGDHVYKRSKDLPAEEQMITALPDVETAELGEEDQFIVIACDGIW